MANGDPPQHHPLGVCPSHSPMRQEILTAVHHLGEMLTLQIEQLREEVTRRMDESAKDRIALHTDHNELAREVTRAMTKLNGATLITVQPHHRSDDKGDVEYPRDDRPKTAAAFIFPPKWIILGVVALAIFAGFGMLLLVQTKLDLDTIKQVQALRQVAQ